MVHAKREREREREREGEVIMCYLFGGTEAVDKQMSGSIQNSHTSGDEVRTGTRAHTQGKCAHINMHAHNGKHLVYVRTPSQGRESSSRRRVRLRTHHEIFERAPHLPPWGDRRGRTG
jgi:hypothetical protein